MKSRSLSIGSDDRQEVYAVIRQQADGTVTVVHAVSEIRNAIDRWIAYGVREWLSVGADKVPRITPSNTPEFFANLQDFILRHSQLHVVITDDVALFPENK